MKRPFPQFHKTSSAYLITTAVLSLVALLLPSPSYPQSRVSECFLDGFLSEIGMSAYFSVNGFVQKDASLGSETRCTYVVEFSSCIRSSQKRLQDYFTLNPARTNADNEVLQKITEKNITLMALRGIRISYTAVRGRVYGATFKDIVIGSNETLDDLKPFASPLKLWCEIGDASDAKLVSLAKQVIQDAQTDLEGENQKRRNIANEQEKEGCLSTKLAKERGARHIYYTQQVVDDCRNKFGIVLPPATMGNTPSTQPSIQQMR